MAGIEEPWRDIVRVHPRVHENHPELEDEDVLSAWMSTFASTVRIGTDPLRFVAIGVDGKGCSVEMIAVRTKNQHWYIIHAFTPPTQNVLKELGLSKERR